MAAGTTLAAGGLFGSMAVAQEGDNGEEGEGNSEERSTEGGADFTRSDGVTWRYDDPHDMRSATVKSDQLYTSEDGTVYALDAEDGSIEWERNELTVERQFAGEAEVTTHGLMIGDTDDQQVYIFGTGSQPEVASLEPATGETELVVRPMEGIAGIITESGYIGVEPPHDSTYLYNVSA
ncbi:PQQ-binding-like beta-propeller repeat protein, partial [Natrinema soli]